MLCSFISRHGLRGEIDAWAKGPPLQERPSYTSPPHPCVTASPRENLPLTLVPGRRMRRPYEEGLRRMRFLCLDSLTDFGHYTQPRKPVEILN
jgi:hypothetical protein